MWHVKCIDVLFIALGSSVIFLFLGNGELQLMPVDSRCLQLHGLGYIVDQSQNWLGPVSSFSNFGDCLLHDARQ